MRILVKESGSVISDVVVGSAPAFIGSRSDCAIRLPDMRIQERHATLLQSEDGQWSLRPASGQARVLLNGHVLSQEQRLSNGDQVSIQDYTLHVYLDFHEAELQLQHVVLDDSEKKQYPLPRGTVARSMRHDLILNEERLDEFTSFSALVQECQDVSTLIDRVLTELMRCLTPRAVWIGIRRRPGTDLELAQGRDFQGGLIETPKLYPSLSYRCLQRGLNVWIPSMDEMDTHSVIAVPLTSREGRLGFLYLDARLKARAFTEQEFDFAIALATVIAHRLEALFKRQSRLRQAASAAQENIIRLIQEKLDPHLVPDWPGLQVAVHCRSGQQQAGDIYDIMQLPNGAAAFLIGHLQAEKAVTAIGMVEARTAFRSGVLNADMPHAVMSRLNWLLCNQSHPVLMDSALVMVDPRTGALLHSQSGSCRAVIISQSGSVRQLPATNPLELGKSQNCSFRTRKGLLGNQESLVMFTPGLLKLQDAQGQLLQESRLLETLCDGFGLSARAALDETLTELKSYITDGYNPEDVTLLLAHRKSS